MNSDIPTQFHQYTPSNGHSAYRDVERAWGSVQDVDLVERDLTVLVDTEFVIFDIPPDCLIMLHGEPIKLRLVQPHDEVRIFFRRVPGRLVAIRLEVQPDRPGVDNSLSPAGE